MNPLIRLGINERENILKAVGVKVEYGEPLYEGEYKGTFRTVGDKEHAEMIRLYTEEELGINKIAEMLGRSSRTPLVQIQRHNKAIERGGFCIACRRVRSKYESILASKEPKEKMKSNSFEGECCTN